MYKRQELASACGMRAVGQVIQRMERTHNALYLGPVSYTHLQLAYKNQEIEFLKKIVSLDPEAPE